MVLERSIAREATQNKLHRAHPGECHRMSEFALRLRKQAVKPVTSHAAGIDSSIFMSTSAGE
jgi:hypothetical protein